MAHQGLECVHSGLDIFEAPGLQTSVERGEYVEYRPLATLDDTGPLEFFVRGGVEYLDLCDSYLRVQVKVTLPNGNDLPPDCPVVPMNLTLHSMFSDVTLFLNTTQVSNNNGAYPYLAYLQTLLSYGPDAKRTQMQMPMYYADTAGHFNDVEGTDNGGMVARKARVARSRVVDMMGRLHCDMFHQGKYLLSHLDMRIKLARAKNAFVLCCGETGEPENRRREAYKLQLLDASLYVRKLTVSPVISLAHEKTLEKANAKYPLTQSVLRVFTAPAGAMFWQEDHLFMDKLPNRVIIGFVKSAAYNGSYSLNPFDFEHVNLNFLRLYHNGQTVPGKGLRPDYAAGQYTSAYMTLFSGTNSTWSNTTHGITLADYPRGYTLYCFDLTPSQAEAHSAVEITRAGPLRVECQFSQGLDQPMNVIILGELDGQVEVTKTREVLTV